MQGRRRAMLLTLLALAALLSASMLAPAFGAPKAVSAVSLAKKLAKTTKIAKRADKNAKRALRKAKTGPRGDTGPAGPKGDRGAPGLPGASGATGGAASSTSVPITWSTTEQTVRSFSLPAGKYVFNAKNTALILGPQTGGVDHASSRGSYALTTGTTLAAPTEVSLRCTASSADGLYQGVGLSAVRIG